MFKLMQMNQFKMLILFFLPSVLGDCCEPIASWVCRKFHTHKKCRVCGVGSFNRDDGMLNHTVCVQYWSHHIAIPHELCAQRNLHFLKNQFYISILCEITAVWGRLPIVRGQGDGLNLPQTTEFPTAWLGLSSLPLMQLHLRRFTYCKPWNTQGRCAAINTINI